MRKNSVLILKFIILAFAIASCQRFNHDEKITGRYHLVSIDVAEDMALSYKLDNEDYLGIVNETVFAVGYCDKYIIAMQHPSNKRKIIQYFIAPIYDVYTLSPEKGVIGPLTLEHFNEKRKELNIPDNVTFTKVIEDLK